MSKIYATALVIVGTSDGYILDSKGRTWEYLFDCSGTMIASDNLLEVPAGMGMYLFQGRLRSQHVDTPDMNEYDEWWEGSFTRLTEAECVQVGQGTYVLPVPADEPATADEEERETEPSIEEQLFHLSTVITEKAHELGQLKKKWKNLNTDGVKETQKNRVKKAEDPSATCVGCQQKIIPSICHCGSSANHLFESHMFIPMGCRCHVMK